MVEVEAEMRQVFSSYRYLEPTVPLLNHIDQDFLSVAEIPDFMMRELELPVYWEKCYKALKKAGAGTFLEVGVGDSLKKYNRWIESEAARQ
jgi:malonyl CoA-acyl carrier protein transacylase